MTVLTATSFLRKDVFATGGIGGVVRGEDVCPWAPETT